jgi:hypothetical protein
MLHLAAPAAVVLALLAGCASTDTSPKATESAAANVSLQCRTGTYICRNGDARDNVQSVSPEVFRDTIGRQRNPTGGR